MLEKSNRQAENENHVQSQYEKSLSSQTKIKIVKA